MKDENIHIGQLLKQCVAYWRIYIPIGVLCLVGAIIFLLLTPSEYRIISRMQFLDKEQGLTTEMKMLKSTGLGGMIGGGGGMNATNEITLLMSRTVLTKAILQTEFQVETLCRDGFKQALLYNPEAPVRYLFPTNFLDTLSSPVTIHLELNGDKIESIRIKSLLFKTQEYKNKTLPFELVLPIGTLSIVPGIKALKEGSSETLATKILPLQSVYETLDKALYISPAEGMSDIVYCEYESENRKRGCDFLNSLMKAYNEQYRRTKASELEINALFVKERLDTITQELAVLEHRIELYKQANKMPYPELYGSAAFMGNKEVEKMILDAETRLRMIDYIINYIKEPANDNSVIPLLDGLGEGAIMAYNQLSFQRQRLLQSAEIDNPALQLVDKQLKEQKKMLLESAANIRKSITLNLETLYKKDSSLSKQLDKLPAQENEFIEMKRQQRIKESIYLFLMQKYQEKELANAPDEIAGRVIDSAYSSYQPIFPKKLIVLAIAFIIACILSLAVISLKVWVFNKKK